MSPNKAKHSLSVVYWNNIPSPYMVERFNAFAEHCSVDFEVWFNERTEADRSWDVLETNWRFRYRYLPQTRFFGYVQHWPLPLLGRRPDVIVSLHSGPAFVIGWGIAKLRGSKTVFRVLKTYDRWVPRQAWKERLKRFLFRHVDGVETPGDDAKGFAMSYGTPENRIFFATHTVDVPHFVQARSRYQPEREKTRSSIGIIGTTFIYVGRLWWGKGVRVLLDAFELAQRERETQTEISLLLVGDGPEEAHLKMICRERNIRNVVFVGFKQKQELPLFYAIADVFVFPTLGDPYGLVVDEAMACSLPVISTTAAGEIKDRIEDGVNGYLVPPDDSDSLAKRMLNLTDRPDLRVQMGKVSANKVQDHTPAKWAENFQHILDALMPRGSSE